MIESVGMALKKKHIIYLKLMCTKSKCEPANDAMRNFITARGKDSGNQNPLKVNIEIINRVSEYV